MWWQPDRTRKEHEKRESQRPYLRLPVPPSHYDLPNYPADKEQKEKDVNRGSVDIDYTL